MIFFFFLNASRNHCHYHKQKINFFQCAKEVFTWEIHTKWDERKRQNFHIQRELFCCSSTTLSFPRFYAFTQGDRSCTWWKIYMKKVVEKQRIFLLSSIIVSRKKTYFRFSFTAECFWNNKKLKKEGDFGWWRAKKW